MTARHAVPAADRRILALEAQFLAMAAEYDRLKTVAHDLRTCLYGPEHFDHEPYALDNAAKAALAEAERREGCGLRDAPTYAAVAAELRRKADAAVAERDRREAEAGLDKLEEAEAEAGRACGDMHQRILRRRPESMVGAAVVLRHLLDADLGIPTGITPDDLPALMHVYRLVNALAGDAATVPGKARLLADREVIDLRDRAALEAEQAGEPAPAG